VQLFNCTAVYLSLQVKAGGPEVPKLALAAAASDDLSAPLAPAVCDSPVVAQRTARAATARGVHAPVGETTDAANTVPSPRASLADDQHRPHAEGGDEELVTFGPPSGPGDAPVDSPRYGSQLWATQLGFHTVLRHDSIEYKLLLLC
jgi:hypothetical protein